MTMSLLVSLFALTILVFIASIFLYVKNERFGMKPAIAAFIIFIICLCIVIPLGNKPLTGDYKKEAATFTYYEYVSESIPIGTVVKVTGKIIELEATEINGEVLFEMITEDGPFYVKNNSVDDKRVESGEVITIYAGYVGNDENYTPILNGQIIEK